MHLSLVRKIDSFDSGPKLDHSTTHRYLWGPMTCVSWGLRILWRVYLVVLRDAYSNHNVDHGVDVTLISWGRFVTCEEGSMLS